MIHSGFYNTESPIKSKPPFDCRWAASVYTWVLYLCALGLWVQGGILCCNHASRSKHHLGSQPCPTPACPCVSPLLTKLGEKNEGSISIYITPFIDCKDEIGGFESALLWSNTRLPGNCCYATIESPPIKVQRITRWGWTAPQFSKYLWGMLFTLEPKRADKKAGKRMLMFPLCPSEVSAAREAWIRQNDASH